MSIRWLNKSYGVLDMRGAKGPSDPHAKEGQSMLASQLSPHQQGLAIEQQTLRTTKHLTEDAIRKALEDAQQRIAQLQANIDQLALDLEFGATGIQTDAASIQGVPVVSTPPTNGQILTYDGGAAGGTGWTPLSLVAGEGIDISVSGLTGVNTILAELASETNRGVVELATSAETTAGLAVQASDTRLSDARTPLAHAASHRHGGSDEVATATPAANAIPKASSLSPVLAAGWLPDATGSTKGALVLANDLAGTAVAPIIAGIRDVNVENVTPTRGDILRHDGTDWKVRPEEIVFMPTDFFLSSNATLLTGTPTNGWLRIEFANATTPDPFAWLSTRFRDEWYDTNLTLQVAFRGTGTAGNLRVWWNLADAGTGIDGTANAVTVAINAASKTVHALSSTVNISSAAGARNVTLLVGRDHDHADDNIADTVDFLFARVFPT